MNTLFYYQHQRMLNDLNRYNLLPKNKIDDMFCAYYFNSYLSRKIRKSNDMVGQGFDRTVPMSINLPYAPIPKLKSVESDIGYPNQSNLVGLYLMLVKKTVPDETVIEIRNILLQSEKYHKVQELYALDYVHQSVIKDYNVWYMETIKQWEIITKGVKVE